MAEFSQAQLYSPLSDKTLDLSFRFSSNKLGAYGGRDDIATVQPDLLLLHFNGFNIIGYNGIAHGSGKVLDYAFPDGNTSIQYGDQCYRTRIALVFALVSSYCSWAQLLIVCS